MKKQLTISNEALANRTVELLKTAKSNPTIEKKDELFVISYEINACCMNEAKEGEEEKEEDKEEEFMSMIENVYSYTDYRFNSILSELDRLYTSFYQHTQNHLPPIVGADKMTKALKVLGLDGEYDVAKKTIFAAKINGKSIKL